MSDLNLDKKEAKMKKTCIIVSLGLVFFVSLFLLKLTTSSQEKISQEYVLGEVQASGRKTGGHGCAGYS